MSILGGGSNAGSLFIPNGLSLHIDAETLNAGEEEERRKDEEKQAEQLRQLICEELNDDLLSDDDDDDDLSRHSRNERRSSSPPRRSDVGWNEGYAEDSVGGGGGVDYRGGEVRDYGGGDEPGHRGGTGDSQGYGGGDTGGPYPREYFEEGRVAPFQDHNWNDLQMKDNNYRHESEPAGNFQQPLMNGQTDIQYHGREGDQADYHQNGPRPLYAQDDRFGQVEVEAEQRQMAQLQILYKARGRKLEELTNDLHILKEDSSREIRMLKHQLNLAQEECGHLKESIESRDVDLDTARQQMSSLSEDVSDLQSRLDNCESARTETIGRLQAREEEIHALRHELEELSRSETLSRAKREHEEIVAGLTERHQGEIASLRQNAERLAEEANAKAILCQRLTAELDSVTRGHEKALMERAEAINRLSRSLEDSQRQCRDLLENGSFAEVGSLKSELQRTKHLREESDRLCSTLRTEVTDLKEQLDLVQSASKLGVSFNPSPIVLGGIENVDATVRKNLNFDSPDAASALKTVKATSQGFGGVEQSMALKAELERALKTIKAKRNMIDELQKIVKDKDEALRELGGRMNEAEMDREVKRNSRVEKESDPLKDPALMTEREQTLTIRLEKQSEEWRSTISDYQKRIEELIMSEENLMTINQELNAQMSAKETEYEEREVKAVEEAREACIAFYENSKREFVRQFEEDAGQKVESLMEENASLTRQLGDALAEVNEARQNYVTLSKESREEVEGEREEMEVKHRDELLALEENWRREMTEALKEKETEEEKMVEELKGRLEEEKKILVEESEREWMEKHKSDGEFEALRLEEERAKHRDEVDALKDKVNQLERLNTQIAGSAETSEVTEQELTLLKAEVKTLKASLKALKETAEKEKNNGINAEKIRQETRYQLKVREMEKKREEEMAKRAREMKKLEEVMAEIEAGRREEVEEEKKKMAALSEEKTALMKEVERMKEAHIIEIGKLKETLSSLETKSSSSVENNQKLQEKEGQLAELRQKVAFYEERFIIAKTSFEEQLSNAEAELRRKSLKLKQVDGLVEEQLKSLRLDLEQDFERGLQSVAAERDKNVKLYRAKEAELVEAQEQLTKWQKASSLIDHKFQMMVKEYEKEINLSKSKFSNLDEDNRNLRKRSDEYELMRTKYEDNLKTTAALEQSSSKYSEELETLKKRLEDLKRGHKSRMEKVKIKTEEEVGTNAESSQLLDKKVEEKVTQIGRDLSDHYVSALNRVKSDVLEYIEKLKQHHAKSLETALAHERRRIAKTLKKYYLQGIEQICHHQRQDPDLIHSNLEKLLHSGFQSLMIGSDGRGRESDGRHPDKSEENSHPRRSKSEDRVEETTARIERMLSEKLTLARSQTQMLPEHEDADGNSGNGSGRERTSDVMISGPNSNQNRDFKVSSAHRTPSSKDILPTEILRSSSEDSQNDSHRSQNLQPIEKSILKSGGGGSMGAVRKNPLLFASLGDRPRSRSPLGTFSFADPTLTEVSQLSGGGFPFEPAAPSPNANPSDATVHDKRAERFLNQASVSSQYGPEKRHAVSIFDRSGASFVTDATSYFDLPSK